MTFSAGDFIGDCKKFSTNSKLLQAWATNPFYAAITITIIVLLIILFTFRHASLPKNESLTSIMVRTGVYSFFFILVIMFCHNYYMDEKYKKDLFGAAPSIGSTISHEDIKTTMPAEPLNISQTQSFTPPPPPPQQSIPSVVEVVQPSERLPSFV